MAQLFVFSVAGDDVAAPPPARVTRLEGADVALRYDEGTLPAQKRLPPRALDPGTADVWDLGGEDAYDEEEEEEEPKSMREEQCDPWLKEVRSLEEDYEAFTFDKLKAEYQRAIAAAGELVAVDLVAVDLVAGLARAAKKAGYTEFGVALFQAMTELAFGGDEKFEEFWTSGAPRVGDLSESGLRLWLKGGGVPVLKLKEPKNFVAGPDVLDDLLTQTKVVHSVEAVVVNEVPTKSDEPTRKGIFFEGLRSFRSDGTAYSIAHGYRINVTEGNSNAYSQVLESLKDAVQPQQKGRRRKRKQESHPLAVAYGQWAVIEEDLDAKQWKPVIDGEPDRVVPLEDVAPYLRRIRSTDARRMLVLRFLSYLGWTLRNSAALSSEDDDDDASDSAFLVDEALESDETKRSFVRNILVLGATTDEDTRWKAQMASAVLVFDAKFRGASAREEARTLLNTEESHTELWRGYAAFEAVVAGSRVGADVCKAAIVRSSPQNDDVASLYWTLLRLQLGLDDVDDKAVVELSDQDRRGVMVTVACLADGDHTNLLSRRSLDVDRTRDRLRLLVHRGAALLRDDQKILVDNTIPMIAVAGCLAWFEVLVADVHAADAAIAFCLAQLSEDAKAARSRLHRIRRELLRKIAAPRSSWVRRTFKPQETPNIDTKAAFSRAVHADPGSKTTWLQAFTVPALRDAFTIPELTDMANELLDRGLRIRDPRVVVIMHPPEEEEVPSNIGDHHLL